MVYAIYFGVLRQLATVCSSGQSPMTDAATSTLTSARCAAGKTGRLALPRPNSSCVDRSRGLPVARSSDPRVLQPLGGRGAALRTGRCPWRHRTAPCASTTPGLKMRRPCARAVVRSWHSSVVHQHDLVEAPSRLVGQHTITAWSLRTTRQAGTEPELESAVSGESIVDRVSGRNRAAARPRTSALRLVS